MRKQEKLPSFRDRLNALLIQSGQTIVAFAEMIGTSRQSLGYYLNGERVPDATMVRQICERCQVSADWLLGLSDVKKPDADVQAVSRYTGLKESAINFFKSIKEWKDGQGIKLINAFFSDGGTNVKFFISLSYLYEAFSLKMRDLADESIPYKTVDQVFEQIEDPEEQQKALIYRIGRDDKLAFIQYQSKKEMNEVLDDVFDSDAFYDLYREKTSIDAPDTREKGD